jgi:hypothetical protein
MTSPLRGLYVQLDHMFYLDHVPVVCFAIKDSIALPTVVIPATGVTSVYRSLEAPKKNPSAGSSA